MVESHIWQSSRERVVCELPVAGKSLVAPWIRVAKSRQEGGVTGAPLLFLLALMPRPASPQTVQIQSQ